MACMVGCLGAPVPVCGVQSNKGTDNGGMEAPMEMCLAFEYESLSVPTALPVRVPGYLDIGLTGCLGVCVSVRVLQTAIKGPCLPSHPRPLLSVCRRHAVATHLVQLPLPSSLRRSPSACLGRHSQSGVGARRCGSLGTKTVRL